MRQTNNHASEPAGYHPVTRWLHAGLVLGVIFQLVCASMMTHPEHDEGKKIGAAIPYAEAGAAAHADMPDMHQSGHKEDVFGKWLMAAHRSVGIFVVLIVLANLLWAVVPRGNPRKRQLAVLVSALHWSEALSIAKQLPWMLSGKKALPEPGNALSLVFEMLGMLVMTAMAITGAVIWGLWIGPGNSMSASAQGVMEVHSFIAVMLFSYLAGHISMALMHARAEDPVFARILPQVIRNRANEGK